jgi:hypothetical protein
MMSFGGGWFFVAASEAISVLNQKYTLPGLGSYVQAAVDAKDLHALGLALLTMGIVIVVVDQLVWRPLVAWSDRFRLEQSASASAPTSWVYSLLRDAHVLRLIEDALRPASDFVGRFLSALTKPRARKEPHRASIIVDRVYDAVLLGLVVVLTAVGLHFVLTTVGFGEVFKTLGLGLATFARVDLARLRKRRLDAGRRRDRLQSAARARLAARRPVPRLISGELHLPVRDALLFELSRQHQLRLHLVDGAGRAVVRPLQRDRGRPEHSDRVS